MALFSIQSNLLKNMRDVLIRHLKENPSSPFEKETILVHSNGMRQWLSQGIAQDLGICANIEFPLPTKFIFQTYQKILADDFKTWAENNPFEAPFDQELLSWQIFNILNSEQIKEKVFSPLLNYFKNDEKDIKKRLLSKTLAGLFENYQSYRADWLEQWQKGKFVLDNGKQLKEKDLWQGHLWQHLNSEPSRVALFKKYKEKLEKNSAFTVEKRLFIFGLTGLSQQSLEFFILYSQICDIYFFIHNPTELYWGDLIHAKDKIKIAWKNKKMLQTPPHEDNLLALLGAQGRDALNLFYELSENKVLHFEEPFSEPQNKTLLNKLQNAIYHLNAPFDTITDNDFSISFHQCHSAFREVEVLNNLILNELDNDKTLNPRDILVLAPDIEKYSPFIDAVFGAYSKNDERYIPYSIADRKKRTTSLFLRALKDLLSLDELEFNPNQIFGLLESHFVRHKFNLNEKEIAQLKMWIKNAEIRWGLTEKQRHDLYQNAASSLQNTWQKGLSRLILGFAMGESSEWQAYLPLPAAQGLNAEPLGKLFLLIKKLDFWRAQFSQSATLKEWQARLSACIADFFAANEEDAEIQQFLNNCNTLVEKERRARELLKSETAPVFSLATLREDFLNLLEEPGLKQPFLDGKLIFATFMPMRAIPHRQIYILGLNDEDFPRSNLPLDFDLIAQNHRRGDRSRTDDDRYMLLETLLAAQEKITFSYVAQNIHDNSARQPSILLAQLQSYITAHFATKNGESIIKHLTTSHPLQAFSKKYNQNNQLFTYSKEWFEYKTVDLKENSKIDYVEQSKYLNDLIVLLKNPALSFFQQTLDAKFSNPEHFCFEETENFGTESLEFYKARCNIVEILHNAFYQKRDRATALNEVLTNIQKTDFLPWGGVGVLKNKELKNFGNAFLQELSHFHSVRREIITIENIAGEIELFSNEYEEKQLILSASQLESSKYLQPFLQHILANAAGFKIKTSIIGLKENNVISKTFEPIEQNQALTILKKLNNFSANSLKEPLPITLKTALAFLDAKNKKNNKEWTDTRKIFLKECEQTPALSFAFADFDDFYNADFQKLAFEIYGDFYNNFPR